jgi:dUTP pyrophosphatase
MYMMSSMSLKKPELVRSSELFALSVDTPNHTKHVQLFTTNRELFDLYKQHIKQTYNSGIDLIVPRDITISEDEDIVEIDFEVSVYVVDKVTNQVIPSLMYPRSSLAKSPLRLANSVGVIDIGYTGNIRGIFDVKRRKDAFTIKKCSRLTQLCVASLEVCSVEIIYGVQDQETNRGKNGFGSSGGTIN